MNQDIEIQLKSSPRYLAMHNLPITEKDITVLSLDAS